MDGVQFTIRHYKPYRYCSKRCGALANPRKANPAKQTTTVCATCGDSFTHYTCMPRIYCSNVCLGKANATNLGAFNLPPSRYETACESCGTSVTTTPAVAARFCSSTCFGRWLSINRTGEAHPSYRGGYDPYYGPSWRPARRAARERDKVCQDCGISPADLGRALDVHHLTPFRHFGRERHAEANRLDNLVSLCPTCHTTREWATNWRQVRA